MVCVGVRSVLGGFAELVPIHADVAHCKSVSTTSRCCPQRANAFVPTNRARSQCLAFSSTNRGCLHAVNLTSRDPLKHEILRGSTLPSAEVIDYAPSSLIERNSRESVTHARTEQYGTLTHCYRA